MRTLRQLLPETLGVEAVEVAVLLHSPSRQKVLVYRLLIEGQF